MAAPTTGNAGSNVTNAGAVAAALPAAAPVVGDLAILVIAHRDNAVGTPTPSDTAGFGTWTQLPDSPVVQGAARLTVWMAVVESTTPTAPTVSDSGDHQQHRVFYVNHPNGTPEIHKTQASVDATSDTSGDMTGVTTTVADCLILLLAAGDTPDANGTTEYTTPVNANLASIVDLADNSVVTGLGSSKLITKATRLVAGAIGTSTYTKTNAGVKAHLVVALCPPGAQTINPTPTPTPPPRFQFRVPGGPRLFRVLQPEQGIAVLDVTVEAPAATIFASALDPIIEGPPTFRQLGLDQQFLMLGPAGLRKLLLIPGQGLVSGDRTVEAPAAVINAPGATPTPEIRVLPAAALLLGAAGVPVPEIRVEPAAARAAALATGVPAITIAPAAATILAPGANPVPEIRVTSPVALINVSAPTPLILVPDRTIFAPAAIINAPGSNPTPTITILPSAATMLGLAAATPTITILPAAAKALGLAGAPTPAITILPAAATVSAPGATPTPAITITPAAALILATAPTPVIITTAAAPPTTPDQRAAQFLIFGPGGRVKQQLGPEPQAPSGDRVIFAPAAFINAPGSTPVPAITVLPGAATLLAAATGSPAITIVPAAATINVPGAAPTPRLTILPAAATAAYTATGTPGLVITPAAAQILSQTLAPVPEIRVLPNAAPINIPGATPTILIPGDRLVIVPAARIVALGTGIPAITILPAAALYTGAALAPTPTIRVLPGAATILAQAAAVPEVRVEPPAARAVVRQGGFGAQVTTPLITILPSAAPVSYVASGTPLEEQLVIAVPAVVGVRANAPTPVITIVVAAAVIRLTAPLIVITGRPLFLPPTARLVFPDNRPKGGQLTPNEGGGDIEERPTPRGTLR